MASRTPLTVGAGSSGAAVAMVASANPFVQQLIGQAESLSAVSRNVESQMKREGIPVLAATRDFLDFAQRGLGTVEPSPRNGSYRQPEPPPMAEPISRPEPRFDDWSKPALAPKSFIEDPMPPRSGAPFIDPPIQRGNSAPFLDDPILRNHISPFLQRPVERDDVSPFIESGPRDLPRRPSSTPRDYEDTLAAPFADPPASRGFDIDDLVDAPEALDDAPIPLNAAPLSEPPAPFNLDVSPFPSLSHDAEEDEVVDIVSFAEPLVMPEVVADATFSDWTDHKNFHSNDHARAYDIDLTPDEHVVAPHPFAARVEPAVVEAAVAVVAPEEIVAESVEAQSEEFDPNKTLIDYGAPPPPLAATLEISATAAKNANLSHTLGRIADHYRHRAQVSASKLADRVYDDAALEPDIAIPAPVVKPGIPGQIGHSYMVTVHNNLEIPKVPPYIWQAPEEIYDRDDAGLDPLVSRKNCTGNRHQLSLDF